MENKEGAAIVFLSLFCALFIVVGLYVADQKDKTIARLEAELASRKRMETLCSGSNALVTCPICGRFEYYQPEHAPADTLKHKPLKRKEEK